MSTQPKALRLADELEQSSNYLRSVPHQAAAELRRLHHELNEANQLAAYQSHRAMDYSGAFMRQKNLNAELVEALNLAIDSIGRFIDDEKLTDADFHIRNNCLALISQAKGEQP